MDIVILSGPNNGAIYINGRYEVSHDSLQRGCNLSHAAKLMEISLSALKSSIADGHYTVKFMDVKVGDEPYLDDHGEFPQNVKLLVGNYWRRRGV
jgi:hypothetical protein